MLEDYKKKLKKYKTNPEDVDYDSLLRECNSIKAEINTFDTTTYRENYEGMRNAVSDLKEDEAKRERARINQDFPYTERKLLPLEKFEEPEEPEKPKEPEEQGFFNRVCCRKKFKSKSKKGKKSGKKGKKTQKSK